MRQGWMENQFHIYCDGHPRRSVSDPATLVCCWAFLICWVDVVERKVKGEVSLTKKDDERHQISSVAVNSYLWRRSCEEEGNPVRFEEGRRGCLGPRLFHVFQQVVCQVSFKVVLSLSVRSSGRLGVIRFALKYVRALFSRRRGSVLQVSFLAGIPPFVRTGQAVLSASSLLSLPL